MTPPELGALLDELATLPYGLEAVDQRSHALQCAGFALADGLDDEMVLACALHDVGRAPSVASAFAHLPHERAGALIASESIGMRAAALVAGHVEAKRYLVAMEPYPLSPASVASLERQGGAMTPPERRVLEAGPFFRELLALRRYDDRAKVPGAPAPSVADVVAIYARLLRSR